MKIKPTTAIWEAEKLGFDMDTAMNLLDKHGERHLLGWLLDKRSQTATNPQAYILTRIHLKPPQNGKKRALKAYNRQLNLERLHDKATI